MSKVDRTVIHIITNITIHTNITKKKFQLKNSKNSNMILGKKVDNGLKHLTSRGVPVVEGLKFSMPQKIAVGGSAS